MKHRDDEPDTATTAPEAVRPDYARGDVERNEQLAEVREPNFATTDIDPAEPDPVPPGTPNFATTDIDPAEADPIDPDQPNYATKDQDL